MHEGPGIEIKKPNMWPAGKVAAYFNKPKTNMETNYERTGCLVIGIGTIIFWSLIIWLV